MKNRKEKYLILTSRISVLFRKAVIYGVSRAITLFATPVIYIMRFLSAWIKLWSVKHPKENLFYTKDDLVGGLGQGITNQVI